MRKRAVSPSAALAAVFAFWALIAAAPPLFRGAPAGPAPLVEQPLVPDLNRAPPHHLILLPNLGPVRAAAIVEERARNGPFASLGDLVRVHGIGPKTVEGLRGLARVSVER